MGMLPFWDTFRRRATAQAMMRGVNAAVVGLLGAALYNPVWTSSVNTPGDFAIALVGFVLLTVWRAPPLIVVIFSALGGIVLAQDHGMTGGHGESSASRSPRGRPSCQAALITPALSAVMALIGILL